MIQKDKELLLTDLCARLPYGFIVHRYSDNVDIKIDTIDDFSHFLEYSNDEKFKPYLRPMSSMTEEEHKELKREALVDNEDVPRDIPAYIDWINAHHFDYRGLIPMGIALEAPDNMYKID